MKRRTVSFLLSIFWALSVKSASADTGFIVRSPQGLAALQAVCGGEGCTVDHALDGTKGTLFLVTAPDYFDPDFFVGSLLGHAEVSNTEKDRLITVSQIPTGLPANGVWDPVPISYYGSVVWRGYANQWASQIIRVHDAQTTFHVTGSGIVAVIDTGVDPDHPALKSVVVPGFDFTRGSPGKGSEMADVTQSTAAIVDSAAPAQVSQSTSAVVDQGTAGMLNNPQYAAFGHGTMVAGVIHLVAPTAKIMPLKAFTSDGTAYLSRVLHAIYYAVEQHADVVNMSFSFPDYSREVLHAVSAATQSGVICVAAAGNDGKETLVYPAGYSGLVMGVASTTYEDTRSSFSNYGQDLVWVAAPGEEIITTYPFATYAMSSGTSFSAPFVAGAAALLLHALSNDLDQAQAAEALGHAKWISQQLGHGRIDIYEALASVGGAPCQAHSPRKHRRRGGHSVSEGAQSGKR